MKSKQKENYLKRRQLMLDIKEKYKVYNNYAKVAREFGLDYRAVKAYVMMDDLEIEQRQYTNDLDEYRDYIIERIDMKVIDIYNLLKSEFDYKKGIWSVKRYIRKIKDDMQEIEEKNGEIKVKIYKKDIKKLIYGKSIGDITNDKNKQKAIVIFLKHNPKIQELINAVTDFRILLFSEDITKLDSWMIKYENIKALDSFMNSLKFDYDAVCNSIKYLDYSNGLVEGKNTKVKFIKRTMFGRCKFDLLRIKILWSEQ